jgi:phage tail-like protein
MTDVDRKTPSKLLEYLPEIYRDQEFLNGYLSAFEKVLIGRKDDLRIPASTTGASSKSLEETIASIATLFDPITTPKDFLPWLASWAALSLRADLDPEQQGSFIANIIRLYRRRGTKDNLIELLRIFTKTTPQVNEDAQPSAEFKERNSYPSTAHFFKVSVYLGRSPDPETVNRQRDIARSLIELEKPAHTFYELEIRFSSMRIGTYDDKGKFRATLGVDTLINTDIDPEELKAK